MASQLLQTFDIGKGLLMQTFPELTFCDGKLDIKW